MNEIELFEFDRQGYIVIEGLLQADVVAALSRAVDDLEEHAVLRVQDPPRKPSGWGGDYTTPIPSAVTTSMVSAPWARPL